jgi:hypothetical protein
MKLNLVKLLTILLIVINISGWTHNQYDLGMMTTGQENIFGTPDWLDRTHDQYDLGMMTTGQENIFGKPDWFDRTHNRYDPSRMTTGQENIFGTPDWFELHCPSGNLRDCGYADLILPDQTDLV